MTTDRVGLGFVPAVLIALAFFAGVYRWGLGGAGNNTYSKGFQVIVHYVQPDQQATLRPHVATPPKDKAASVPVSLAGKVSSSCTAQHPMQPHSARLGVALTQLFWPCALLQQRARNQMRALVRP